MKALKYHGMASSEVEERHRAGGGNVLTPPPREGYTRMGRTA